MHVEDYISDILERGLVVLCKNPESRVYVQYRLKNGRLEFRPEMNWPGPGAGIWRGGNGHDLQFAIADLTPEYADLRVNAKPTLDYEVLQKRIAALS